MSLFPGVKKHKSKFSPYPAISQMKVKRMVLKTHWVKGKKGILSTLTQPVCPATQPAHNSVLLIEYQLNLHMVVRGGERKVLWMSLKAQPICSPIFKHFFSCLLHKPVSPPHLVKKLHAQVSDLILCSNVCGNKFNFFFQRHCKF